MKKFLKNNLEIILLSFILLAGIFLRFWNLNSTPGWWPDEGVYLNIANNLIHSKAQMFSFTYPFVPHPPLYFFVVSLFIKIFGYKMIAIRLVSAVSGSILIYLVYLIGKTINKSTLGLIAAFLIAVMPETVVFSRYGLPYNLLILLIALVLYFFIKYHLYKKTKDLYLSSACAGLALATSYSGIVLPFFLLIYGLYSLITKKINRKQFIISILLCSIPFLLYLTWGLIFINQAFVHDILFTLRRKSSSLVDFSSFLLVIFSINIYFILGVLGLFYLPKEIRFWLVLFFLTIILVEYRIRHEFVWYSVTYLFIIYLGLANFIMWLSQKITEFFQRGKAIGKFYYWLIIIFLLTISLGSIKTISTRIIHRDWIQTKLNASQEELFSTANFGYPYLYNAINYINSRVNDSDTVMASPHLTWMINALPTDPIQSYIYRDKSTFNFSNDMRTSGRFLYDPSYQKAKYLLDDKFMRNWFYGQPGIKKDVLDDIYKSWIKVFEEGDFKVYQNPNI